ncbi:MAG TPA: OmpA family protein [Bacteroidales bacterium]|nr:OmpA family protein [Bacteroidales bacterium]
MMKFFISFVAIAYVLMAQVFAQGSYLIKPENADCSKPLEIKDTIFGPTNAPAGYGSVMEISGSKTSLYTFEKEHNTCWYFFKAKYDAHLEIDIIPVNINDDYDFILYRYNGRTFCSDVASGNIKPVRTCISRNDKKIKSRTGLSKQASEEYIHSGPGHSFSKSIRVKKGEIFYLVVDNVYPNGSGHTVILHYSDIKKTEDVVKTQNKTTQKTVTKNPKNTPQTIKIVDKETRQPVTANLKVYYKSKPDLPPAAAADSVSSYESKLALSTSFIIKTEANNYFDDAKDFKTNATGEAATVIIELSRIKPGQNVVFEDILFYGNSDKFLPESKPYLEIIATTMKRNPGLKIEIQGHVNCPSIWPECDGMEDFNMRLSVSRAVAVYNYLSDAGIGEQRMSTKGFGASKMVFPDARSEDKMKKNRRVEILIVSL